MDTIAEGIVVLVRRHQRCKISTLKKGKKLHFEKLSFYPDGALGQYFGSCFEVHGEQLILTSNAARKFDDASGPSSGVDNRGIVDDGTAQTLTHIEITGMKEQGITGQDLVESVVGHSTSFQEKTKFSQEKYIKKKEKKHLPVLTIVRPTTKDLCEMYYARGPSRICHLRTDTVAHILTLANIHAHSNVIVMETCQGLLVGALLERMGGYGNLIQVFFGDFPVRFALDNFGHLTEKDISILSEYPLHQLGSLALKVDDHSTDEQAMLKHSGGSIQERNVKRQTAYTRKRALHGRSEVTDDSEDSDELLTPSKRARVGEEASEREEESKRGKDERYKFSADLLMKKQMDGLIIASRFHPKPILMTLIQFVASSRPFVVYCHLMEPLIQCYKCLKESGLAFNLHLSENWLRHYQMLPERTHPTMNMNGSSGYLLTGITIKANTAE